MRSVGDCSVCASAGAAVIVASISGGALFFACPACGCAWGEPPEAHRVDTVDSPARFAPAGFRVASREEVERAGLDHRVVAVHTERTLCSFAGDEGFVG